MKRIIIKISILALFLLYSHLIIAQTIYVVGQIDGDWGPTHQMNKESLGGNSFYKVTIQATESHNPAEFLFESDNYYNKWNDVTASVNTVNTYIWHDKYGGNNNVISAPGITSGKYYTFRLTDNGYNNSSGIVMETSAQPVTIDAVSQSPLASVVSDNDDVTVTITTSASPCAEEHIFVRYSTDNWTSSSVVEATFTGTSGTATIPAQSAETSLSYYVFSTTVSNPTSDYDLLTIHYNDNSGTHYNYTVKYGTTANGDWNNTSTWKAGAVPGSTKDVIINHAVTVSNSISSPAECNNLIINNGTLTININSALTVNGTFTNNGTFTANQGTVNFPGGNTVSGTVTFYDVNISGGVDFGSNSTISGTLTINTGGYVNTNPPVYGTGSTLKYNTGGTYDRNKEWMSTSGAGYPYNVQISNNTTVNVGANSGTGTERDIANNLIIDAGSELALNIDNMAQPVVVNGDVTVNGTLSLSNSPGGDLKLKGNLVFGSSSTLNSNSRAIFFIGETTQTVQATNASTYDIDYLVIGTPGGGATTLQLDAVDIVTQGPNGGNAITFENANDKIDLNGRKLTIGTAGSSSTISGSGYFVGSTTSEMVIHGTGNISLNFDQTTPGTTNTLKNLTIDRTGGTVTFGNNVEIASGGVWTINPNSHLTVSGSLTNNAGASGLVISSDATGNGSLIFTSGTPAATVQRYIAAYASGSDGWHEIGSPVDMTVSGSDFAPGDGDDLYYWKESTNEWTNYKQGAFSFTQGSGYLVAYQATATKNFTGNLTAGNKTYNDLSYTPSSGRKGWHLLGNPYTSAILWDNGGWTFTNVSHTCAVWNESGGTYFNPNTNAPIPSTNGFFVEVTSGTNTLTIPASARSHNTQNNYKSEEKNLLLMTVTSDANSYYNTIKVGFKPDATEAWDIQYDAHKLYGYENAPELWTVSNGEEFSVNILPFVNDAYDLPLNFKAGVDNANYSITIEGVSEFNPNSSIILEDLIAGTSVDLRKQQSYTFTGNKQDTHNRFVLHFYNVTAVPETDQKSNGVLIYSYQHNIILKPVRNTLDGTIEVVNLLGQVVYSEDIQNKTFRSINNAFDQGIYIVRYRKTDGYVQTQKVIIN